jgi:hypothetical protein
MNWMFRDIRNEILRPVRPVSETMQMLDEMAAIMFAERIVERAYLREQIMEAFSE